MSGRYGIFLGILFGLVYSPCIIFAQEEGDVTTVNFTDTHHHAELDGQVVSSSNATTGLNIRVRYWEAEPKWRCDITLMGAPNVVVGHYINCTLDEYLCLPDGERELRSAFSCVCEQCFGYDHMSCFLTWNDCEEEDKFDLVEDDDLLDDIPATTTIKAGLSQIP